MKKLIEMYKDPKKKAIAQLILFFIFFVFVFIFIKTGNSINNSIEPIEPRSVVSNNYTYTYTINNVIINGSNINNQDAFIYNNIEYKLNNNNYIDSNGNLFVLDNLNIGLFNRQNIINITNNIDYIETTTYKDKTVKTVYEISYKTFGLTDDTNTNITVYKDINDNIVKCELILYNYNIVLEYNINKE